MRGSVNIQFYDLSTRGRGFSYFSEEIAVIRTVFRLFSLYIHCHSEYQNNTKIIHVVDFFDLFNAITRETKRKDTKLIRVFSFGSP